MAVPDDALRGAGLSANKLASLRDLSAKVLDGTVVLGASARVPDEEIIAGLVTVRGIGRWTAEMYLMFELRRLDVWPIDDLGVRQGYGFALVDVAAAHAQGAAATRRSLPPVPLGGRPVLLGGRRPRPLRCRHRPPVGPPPIRVFRAIRVSRAGLPARNTRSRDDERTAVIAARTGHRDRRHRTARRAGVVRSRQRHRPRRAGDRQRRRRRAHRRPLEPAWRLRGHGADERVRPGRHREPGDDHGGGWHGRRRHGRRRNGRRRHGWRRRRRRCGRRRGDRRRRWHRHRWPGRRRRRRHGRRRRVTGARSSPPRQWCRPNPALVVSGCPALRRREIVGVLVARPWRLRAGRHRSGDHDRGRRRGGRRPQRRRRARRGRRSIRGRDPLRGRRRVGRRRLGGGGLRRLGRRRRRIRWSRRRAHGRRGARSPDRHHGRAGPDRRSRARPRRPCRSRRPPDEWPSGAPLARGAVARRRRIDGRTLRDHGVGRHPVPGQACDDIGADRDRHDGDGDRGEQLLRRASSTPGPPCRSRSPARDGRSRRASPRRTLQAPAQRAGQQHARRSAPSPQQQRTHRLAEPLAHPEQLLVGRVRGDAELLGDLGRSQPVAHLQVDQAGVAGPEREDGHAHEVVAIDGRHDVGGIRRRCGRADARRASVVQRVQRLVLDRSGALRLSQSVERPVAADPQHPATERCRIGEPVELLPRRRGTCPGRRRQQRGRRGGRCGRRRTPGRTNGRTGRRTRWRRRRGWRAPGPRRASGPPGPWDRAWR